MDRGLHWARRMRLSAFNIYVDDFPHTGETLIHNTFSGAYVILEEGVVSALRKRERGAPLGDAERVQIGRPADLAADLAALADPDIGVVVASLEQEEREYRAWFEEQRSRAGMRAIVSINQACNFDCPYCCQADIMNGAVMKPAMVARTADWLAERALAIAAPSLHVTFVGGEPLLHPERIRALMERVHARLVPANVAVSMGLITNGYFLDDALVISLLPLGLTDAQVTLDGDATTHARSRVARSGDDTFARIFANVIAASRHIRISINGNYQDDTIAGFGPLIRSLAEAALPAQSCLHFSPALEILGAPPGSGSGASTWSDSAHGYRVALHDEIVRHGYETHMLHAIGPCSFHDRHMYAIDAGGVLYKCPGFLGHPEWGIGHVVDGLNQRYEQMLAVDTGERCGDCSHRPSCAGGCLAGAFLRTGRMGEINCERDYFESVKAHALPRGYLLAVQGDPRQAMAGFPAPPVALPATTTTSRSGQGVRSPALRVLS